MWASDQLALLSASLRHQVDAEALLTSSPDQAWHLAGFATECIRKAALSVQAFRKALGHEQSGDFDKLFDLVAALDPAALRFHLTGWAAPGTRLSEWDERHRYDGKGAHASKAAMLVDETQRHHRRTLFELWLSSPFDPGTL